MKIKIKTSRMSYIGELFGYKNEKKERKKRAKIAREIRSRNCRAISTYIISISSSW